MGTTHGKKKLAQINRSIRLQISSDLLRFLDTNLVHLGRVT